MIFNNKQFLTSLIFFTNFVTRFIKIMIQEEITYKDFVEKIAEKYYAIYLSENLKTGFSAIYGTNYFQAYKNKEVIQTILCDYTTTEDISITNIHDFAGHIKPATELKETFIYQSVPFLLEKATGNEIVKISTKKQTYYVTIRNNMIFEVIANHILESAGKVKDEGKIVTVNLYLSGNIDYLALSKTINRTISKKLPVVFLLWEDSMSGFKEIDSRLSYYGGFFNILANYSQDKVTYNQINYNNFIETTKTIKNGIDKARKNIPAVFTVSQELTKTLSAAESYKEWIIKAGIISNDTLKKIEYIASCTVKSHLSKNHPEKFFYNLCKALNKENCTPEKGFKLFASGEKLPDNFLKEYPFAWIFNNYGKQNYTPIEISFPTTKQEMKLAAQYGQKLLEQGTYILKNVPENEFLYVYFSLKKNVFRLPIPQSTIILEGKDLAFAEKFFEKTEKLPETTGVFIKK